MNKHSIISFRPKATYEQRLADLVEATGHKQTHFIDRCIEAHLEKLEQRHKGELDEYRASRAKLNEISSTKAAVRGKIVAAVKKYPPLSRKG